MYEKGWQRYLILALFIGPSLLGLTVFVLIPIVTSLVLSFTSWDLLTPPRFVALDNYRRLLNDDEFWRTLGNTAKFLLGYVPLVMLCGLTAAIALNQRVTGRSVFRTVYFIPVVTSWVAVSLLWMWLYNPVFGLVNNALGVVGIKGPGWLFDVNWAMPAVILTSVWKDTGFLMVILLAGLQGIPSEYHEAASIDGATGWQQIRHITIPLLMPALYFALMISLINSFQVFDQVYVMTGGGPAGATQVLMERIVSNAFSYNRMGYAAAMSWVLFLFIFVTSWGMTRLRARISP